MTVKECINSLSSMKYNGNYAILINDKLGKKYIYPEYGDVYDKYILLNVNKLYIDTIKPINTKITGLVLSCI
jgi:hypothetical protein